MSEQSQGISDDQLPEDLKPGEDNPLAEPLDPDDEATKSQEELEMDATRDDISETASETEPVSADTDSEASANDAAEEV
jgi:hypothetical protein